MRGKGGTQARWLTAYSAFRSGKDLGLTPEVLTLGALSRRSVQALTADLLTNVGALGSNSPYTAGISEAQWGTIVNW